MLHGSSERGLTRDRSVVRASRTPTRLDVALNPGVRCADEQLDEACLAIEAAAERARLLPCRCLLACPNGASY
jgi:hypothetical protein